MQTAEIIKVLYLAVKIFPWAVLFVIGFALGVALIFHEEGTISPARLLMIYRKQFVTMLKKKNHANPS
jgi:hypothetical protein